MLNLNITRLLVCTVYDLFLRSYFRHNITAPALKGCMDHVIANTETVKYETTIGVGNGCPVLLLVNRRKYISPKHSFFFWVFYLYWDISYCNYF